MKVKKLINLLNKENPEATIFAYLCSKEGWEMVDIGINGAIIGKTTKDIDNFVLLPIDVPEKLQPWKWKKKWI